MTSQSRIRAVDKRFLDDLFEMGGGYVLDFSNRTFSEFFKDELEINIDDPRYDVEGTSKAKRLRYFLRISDPETVTRTLLALWEYRETNRRRFGVEETIHNAEEEFFRIIEKLGGQRHATIEIRSPEGSKAALNKVVAFDLSKSLVKISNLPAQERGYAFERFLKDLFDANELSGRDSFRIRGEQIDGSFLLDGETYLLEAKWTSAKADAAILRSFNAKVEEKAAWTRGLFVSHSGFTDDGLFAFGRGKRVVCMDGLDLYDMLNNCLGFADVLSRKVRRASETGLPFVRVRDIYTDITS